MKFVLVSLVLTIAPIVFVLLLVPFVKARRTLHGIINFDMFSQNFLFKINSSKEVFLQQLKMKNAYDTLDYTFDINTMTIVFSLYFTSTPYAIIIREFDDGCYVKLSHNPFATNRVASHINKFMIDKFKAEPLPYEEYKNIII